MEVEYKINQTITADQFIGLLSKTSLGARRPIDQVETIDAMLANANLLVTAWQGDRLIGVARSVTDFAFCCYLSDIAVDESIQASGIGKTLIRMTKEALKPTCSLILLSAPQAVGYYPKIGFTQHNSAWVLTDIDDLK
ncbi:GNAT family N-acetyltransferase [Marinomonas primoryensis]|jgi:N-acetylglutamate synthase-like GNAT family acetyltransferase|uniref:GNAT family N-acetyltransferase n=1 Tax=Marinomonas primoryensis TaxID=178399 RepID=A0A859CT45_9GAMM|nr:GNAT family N-acetyltransferase [Marinomonas primoryensis]QKK79403.1 GNAT family N-acetyltransferase [Marinomonas primoryensis]|tara:strand:+ start:124 stop:537 length:414 start_codon:yes stop_codon:yes gene_type:complete